MFDSGLGGISVLRELTRVLPNERYLYLGDSANAPYGTRTTAEVQSLTLSAIESQMSRGVKAIVVACNTATAAAIEELRLRYPDKIVIGVEPALKLAAEQRPDSRILVMATNVTLREARFSTLMERFSQTNEIIPLPCPGLVEFVESGHLDTPEVYAYISQLLKPFSNVDAIVLGCTHFPFLKKVITEIAGSNVKVVDGALGTAQQTRRRLEAEDLLRTTDSGAVEIINTLGTPEILALSGKLLEKEV